MEILNALTVDVEDYYQVSNFEGEIRRIDWPNYSSRVESNTHRILEMLDQQQVSGTFFVLGYTAERHPQLVRDIDAAGHEIASHSYWHRLVYELTPDEFRADLRRSRDILQNIIGKAVTTFRAPSFSITKKSLWALEILAEEGFTIDSSIFPIVHDRYGIPDARCEPHIYDCTAGRLWEFPISVCHVAGKFNFPISGGGYFRFLPFWLTEALLGRVNRRSHMPFVFYVHPWEFDPDQPRLPVGTRLQRFRHYVNLDTTERKFLQLLNSFSFGRIDEVLEAYQKSVQPNVTPVEVFPATT